MTEQHITAYISLRMVASVYLISTILNDFAHAVQRNLQVFSGDRERQPEHPNRRRVVALPWPKVHAGVEQLCQ